MQIFEPVLEYLRMIGLSWNQSVQKFPFNERNLISLFIFVLNLVCKVGYLAYGADNLRNTTDSMLSTVILIGISTIFFNLIWKMQKLFEFFSRLDDIVTQKLEDPTSQPIYMETGEKIQKWTRISKIGLLVILPIAVVVLPLFSHLCKFFTTDLGADALELPCTMWFSFPTHNLFGYLFACAIEYVFTVNMALSALAIIAIADGSRLILISIADDLRSNLDALNEDAKENEHESEVIQRFNQLIQCHADAKQLIRDFSKIMECCFAVVFWWGIATVGTGYAILLIEWRRYMISDDMQDFSKMFKVMGVIYACCAFGHKLDNAFGETNDALKHLDWYKFPMQIWKQLPTVIAAAQQPAELKFIGSIPCTREGYKNIYKAACYYSLIFL